ncbi:serine/threonine-protein kinase pim-2-like [Centropristis striata]|uniref:serine/threonine-protein kinase pim-2-like n=1 Tax=Centropristis striata TaxID=184440 RepID=UPI0027E215D2|nr:serine/threonine-protein kinase pim-2-like [Centropristis striata]
MGNIMHKDSAKNSETCDSPAHRTCQEHNSTSAKARPARKRKASPDQRTLREEPSKMRMGKRRRFDLFDNEKACCSKDIGKESCNASVLDVKKRGSKRKADTDVEGPSRKKMRKMDLNGTKKETRKETKKETRKETRKETKKNVTKTANKNKAKKETKQTPEAQRAKFNAKYKQQKQLGEGGCGSLFAGYRKADHLPVAIKHIPRNKILYCKHVDEDGKLLSVEVAIMLKLAASTRGSVESPASISLLDWYDLGKELILVLERPLPSKDLLEYIDAKGGCLKDAEAKIIMKQLISAVVQLQNERIFHRDIKVDNILIETLTMSYMVRCQASQTYLFETFAFEQSFFLCLTLTTLILCLYILGASAHTPPEWFITNTYRPGLTTIWQLGVILYEMLHRESFETTEFLDNKIRISEKLPKDCSDLLRMCLTADPKQRVTLEQLQLHQWLR